MIRVAVFPEKTDVFLSEALCTVMFFLVGKQQYVNMFCTITTLSSRPSGTGILACFGIPATGAEAEIFRREII
jgi:hypothetical protein